jgi:RimJ/RimL family protein N-acetyltransferase
VLPLRCEVARPTGPRIRSARYPAARTESLRNAYPQLQLETLFILDERGRIRSTREPRPAAGPAFMLIRGRTEVAWAVHADLPEGVAAEVIGLARREPPLSAWDQPPVHAERYQALVGERVDGGPAYRFPASLVGSGQLTSIHDEAMLQKHFTGWAVGEIEAGAGPMMGIVVDGYPVSVCFCARRSDVAAEAGVETAPAFRGRGFAPRAVSAWAAAVRISGRVPLYSTSWTNSSSQRVAVKLGLERYATTFSIDIGSDSICQPAASFED